MRLMVMGSVLVWNSGAIACLAGPEGFGGDGQALLGGLLLGDIPTYAQQAGCAVQFNGCCRKEGPDDLSVLQSGMNFQVPAFALAAHGFQQNLALARFGPHAQFQRGSA